MLEPKQKNEIKIPTQNGLAEARKQLKDIRRKAPSSELIKIIDEVTQPSQEKEEDKAARPYTPGAEV